MGFLNTDSLPYLVEKLSDANNIKITGNSKGNRVGTVIDKIVEKADDVTKAIEQEVVNESYSFKVGTGDVDVSSSAEDGFGEVGIKGVTYVNIANKENSYVASADGSQINTSFPLKHSLKANTKYTLVQQVSNFKAGIYSSIHFYDAFIYTDGTMEQYSTAYSKNGINVHVITPKKDVEYISITIGNNNYDTANGIIPTITLSDFIILEGDHTNNPNLPSYFEGIVGVGDKSKNLFDISQQQTIGEWINQYGAMGSSTVSNTTGYIKVSPQTTLTLSVKENDTTSRAYCFFDIDKNVISGGSTYSNSATFTTPNNVEYIRFSYYKNAKYIQLEEGNMVTSYEPYYDGHKIEILSCGKNLFNESKHLFNVSIGSESSKKWGTGKGGNRWSLKVPCKPNTTYTITKIGGDRFGVWTNSFDFDGNKEQELDNLVANNIEEKTFTFTTPPNAKVVCIYLSLNEKSTNIHLEESPTPTPYAPYQQDKTQILLDEPLMKLPNGVCDEITRDGKLIKRTYKFKLNRESLNNFVHVWGYQNATTDYIRFYRYMRDTNLPRFSRFSNGNGLCNLISTNANGHLQEKETFGVGGSEENLYISFSISSDKIPNFDFDNYGSVENRNLILDYLDKNNYEIYYELETPMITELSAPSLRIFKDGHLTFNTLVAPTSTHLVQLNKSAQIERSIREVQGLDGRVEKLESFYDDMILETSHKLNLLNYDFDYMRNTEDEI